ncbi:hypothetical protein SAMN06265337_1654 [Hymenobacter gelipurpurascens]|uniref:DUF2268 domain-containing protein n=1 Tax=Hymenobacter gelipurpurascens TaxID=89968 RepID=A0A212TKQ9_9BACT|nr:hypothetical protein [Hymenobacter gelipurpurascens]SNC66565.1 hypothetical protein SAMN06265337_1654 [Hymenobacter gelipurpurascens]
MLQRTLAGLVLLFTTLSAVGQQRPPRIIFSDIDRFWVAYDSMRTTTDSLRQLQYINALYIKRGTPGLRALMDAKEYKAEDWVSAVRRYPRFWASIRPRTQLAKTAAAGIAPYLGKLQQLYPPLRPASLYFTIGALSSGGTTKDSLVLIGTELATGNTSVDISEFAPGKQAYLKRHFQLDPLRDFIPLNVHEYVHTQLKGPGNRVLGQAIYEGTCDLLAELATGKPVPQLYMTYGPKHETELKERFGSEMFNPNFGHWFYNQESTDPHHVPDLGYYMGYSICRTYYRRAKDKPRAIREMVELDYTNDQAVEAFLLKSGYYASEAMPRLKEAYARQRPTVVGVRQLPVGNQSVEASLQELTIEFSEPMAPYTSIDYGPGGKAMWPLVGYGRFSPDKKTVTYKAVLQPDHDYEFLLTGDNFQSLQRGLPLQPRLIKFRTSH